MYKQGYSQKKIAEAIEKDKSVVSRELKRNADERGRYSFRVAQELVGIRKERFRKTRRFDTSVRRKAEELLSKDYSPEQVVGWCRLNGVRMVSTERIYQHIRADRKAGGDLYTHCRHKLKHRRRPVGKRSNIVDRVSIDQRPAEADGTRFGDWEMDTIVGKQNKGAMLTLVERKTGYTIIEKLENGKDACSLAPVVIRTLLPYKPFVRTITTDNGSEFAQHKMIAKKLSTSVFFAHPYSSWEKGLIEYTNKLYRQYIPKKADFNNYNSLIIKEAQYSINKRPRKKLGFKSPLDLFFLSLNDPSCIY